MKHVNKIIGRTRTGRPVYAIAGGSGEPPPQQQGGDTITVQEGAPASDAGENRGEEPPAKPAPQADPNAFVQGFQEQVTNDGTGNQPVAGQTQNPETGRVFTQDEVERFRQQERDKLYPRIEELTTEVRTLREEREAEKRAREEEEARQAEAAREAEESDMDVRELIRKKETEWTEQMQEIRRESERAQALLEQERRFNAMQEYKRQKLEAHEDDIMPHLRPYVDGTTEEEIDASIQRQIETTQAIMADVAQAQQQQQQQVPGTRVTAPGDGGPIEQTTASTRNFSAEDIANMPPAEYAKYRDSLLGAAAQHGPYGR